MDGVVLESVHEHRLLEKLRRDLGTPTLQALADPQTIEIMLNADGQLWQERFGHKMQQIGRMTPGHAEAIMRTIAACLDTIITRTRPTIEGELPLDGSRFAGQLPPMVSAPVFAIRKKASAIFTLNDYVAAEILTPHKKTLSLRQYAITKKCPCGRRHRVGEDHPY